MNTFPILLVCLGLFVVVVPIVRLFNHLVLLRHNVERAWSDIAVLIRQRQEELGNLIVVCRAHADFESGVLERVTHARAQVSQALMRGDPKTLAHGEHTLRQDLDRMIVLGEAHPKLHAQESFVYLSRRISELESSIADRRAFYNETVEVNNDAIQSFPEILIANTFRFRAAQFLATDVERWQRTQA
jgi:LemA protein